MDIIEYNAISKQEYEKSGDLEILGRYVVSEAIPPIEDCENAINIIRNSYKNGVNSDLLIIGAYLASEWIDGDNEMLEILNLEKDHLPAYEQSMISFLNAHHLRFKDENYKCNPKYKEFLLESIEKSEAPFVNNRVYLAQLYEGDQAKKLYKEALSNVKKVNFLEDISDLKLEEYINAEWYINEFVTGTRIPRLTYDAIYTLYLGA